MKPLKPLKPLKSSDRNLSSRSIEFQNNGVSDSLTGAPAPKIFFDNLAREISKSLRKSQSISIITIKLLPEGSDFKKSKKLTIQNKNQNNQKFEKNLALVNNCIKSNMRGSDFYSRIAENGFWLCVQGDLEEAMRAGMRINQKLEEKLRGISDKAKIEKSFSEWSGNQDVKNWIDEIDLQFFLN